MAEFTIKVYDDDILMMDAVYCHNNDTRENGLYDYIGERFYLEAEPELPCGGDLQWLDTSIQYIDTGIVPPCCYAE